MSEALLIPLVGIGGTLIGTIASAVINKVVNRKKNNADIQNIESDVIHKLHENYADVLEQLDTERKKAEEERISLNNKIDEQSRMITNQNDKIDAQNAKIDKLLGLMNFICLDMSCKDRKVCPKDSIEEFIEIK